MGLRIRAYSGLQPVRRLAPDEHADELTDETSAAFGRAMECGLIDRETFLPIFAGSCARPHDL